MLDMLDVLDHGVGPLRVAPRVYFRFGLAPAEPYISFYASDFIDSIVSPYLRVLVNSY